ncbi:hypothetical protein B0H14DRAFT_2600081 [Mycena olivaceomarginata]|nr:hypothetical protein B0H14DRAFT_2600081 [Mycena olivaceomarginata]
MDHELHSNRRTVQAVFIISLSPVELVHGFRQSDKFEVNGVQHPVPRWSPKLLHALPTGTFAGFLLLFIIALELFNQHTPYNAPSTGLQFLWTYVPVGALMIVNWICTAYDLQIKILVPWAAMSRGPGPELAPRLYRRQPPSSHIVVLLTTLGLWMTVLAGIVTTSLFQRQENVQMTAADFNLTMSLNRSLLTDFHPSILVAKQYVSSYLGRQVVNLSRSYWTTSDEIVLEAFENPLGSSAGDRLIAQTQGYSASLDCLSAPDSYGGNVSIRANPPIPALPVGFALFVDVNATGCTVKYPLTDMNHLLVCGNGYGTRHLRFTSSPLLTRFSP